MAATVKVWFGICFLFVTLFLVDITIAIRKVQTNLNPGCDKDCGGGVAYIKAKGDQNTLHYVVTPIGPPTILVIMTENLKRDTDEGISIDWTKIKSDNMTERAGAITIHKDLKVLYTYGVVFTRLFQYNDTSDKANLQHYNINSTAWKVYDFSMSSFEWEDLQITSSDYNIVLKALSSVDIGGQMINNGSLQFKFNFFDHMDRATALPHLQYSEDICQFDFLLMDIDTGNMSLSRFALEAALFSKDDNKGEMEFKESKSIDDEYTPGVFKISDWITNPQKISRSAFLQHKPVCYTKSTRGRQDATYVRGYSLSPVTNLQYLLDQSALYSYLGSGMSELRISSTNFSFGLGEDGTFTKTNYTVWTASLGYGEPPKDAVSTLVIGVISAGLGVPVVLIFFGGLFVCFKRKTEIIDVSKQALIN